MAQPVCPARAAGGRPGRCVSTTQAGTAWPCLMRHRHPRPGRRGLCVTPWRRGHSWMGGVVRGSPGPEGTQQGGAVGRRGLLCCLGCFRVAESAPSLRLCQGPGSRFSWLGQPSPSVACAACLRHAVHPLKQPLNSDLSLTDGFFSPATFPCVFD